MTIRVPDEKRAGRARLEENTQGRRGTSNSSLHELRTARLRISATITTTPAAVKNDTANPIFTAARYAGSATSTMLVEKTGFSCRADSSATMDIIETL